MGEKTENKLEKKIINKDIIIRQGIVYFIVGVLLIMTYYCINHVPVLQSGLSRINEILTPFYIGIIMAYLLCPVYNGMVRVLYRLNKGRFKKPSGALKFAKFIATIVALALIIVVVAGLLALVIPDLINSVVKLIYGVPDAVSKIQDWVNNHINENPELLAFLQDKLSNLSNTALEWAQQTIIPGVSTLVTGVMGTLGTVADLFVALIICVYILNSKESFVAQTKKLVLAVFKPETSGKIFEFGRISNETFGGFINGKIIDSIIIGILCFIAMTIMNLPMTMLISVVVGVTNIIPFFGPFIGAIPSIFILLIIDPIAALKFSIMVVVLQQIDGNIIGPKILGKATKLASFWVMFAIIVGGGLFGFLGMILGVPVFAVIYFYTSRCINRTLDEKDLPTNTLIYEDFSKYGIDKEDIFGNIKHTDRKQAGGSAETDGERTSTDENSEKC